MAIEFVHGSDYWRCDLQIKWNWNKVPPTDYECLTESGTRTGITTRPRCRIPGRQMGSVVENHNVAVKPAGATAAATALSADGSGAEAYQLGSIQWSADSRTLTAYRVGEAIWQSDSVTGNVKKHIARGEWAITSGR